MRPVSPRVARNKKSGKYPTSPNKANTVDLSRFVGGNVTLHPLRLWKTSSFLNVSATAGQKLRLAILHYDESAAELLCCTFVYNNRISFLWSE